MPQLLKTFGGSATRSEPNDVKDAKIAGSRTLMIAALLTVFVIVLVAGLQRLASNLDAITAPLSPAEQTLRINRLREEFHDSYGRLLATAAVVLVLFTVVVVLANASLGIRQKEELAQRVILSISKVLAQNTPATSKIKESLQTLCDVLSWQAACYWTPDDVSDTIRCDAFFSRVPLPNFEQATSSLVLKKGEGLPGRVWRQRTSVWIPDVVSESNFARAASAQQHNLHSAFAFPVTSGGKVIGVLEFFNKKIAGPDKALLSAFNVVGGEIGQFFERQRIENELLKSEGRFREFAGAVDEVFFVSSPTLTEHYYVSPAFEKVWGYPVAEVLANPHSWTEAILPEHKQRVVDYVESLGKNETPAPEIEYPITRTDGRIAWLSARVFRIMQPDGSWQSCGTVRDITERKEWEQRMSEFYTIVSHELRTPLTSINGVLLLLERGKAGDLSEKAQELISLGRRECERLIKLTNDMLDMKRIEAGRLSLYRQNLLPADVVRQTLEMLTAFAAEHNVNLKQSIETGEPINADKDLTIQVITNLVSNAIKFSPPNSEVVVTVDKVGDAIRFSVSDNGPGINKEDQLKLFNVFQQIARRDGASKEGSGLGLAICKGIVEEHGGKIGVISEEGQGATFWFELPKGSTDQVPSSSHPLPS